MLFRLDTDGNLKFGEGPRDGGKFFCLNTRLQLWVTPAPTTKIVTTNKHLEISIVDAATTITNTTNTYVDSDDNRPSLTKDIPVVHLYPAVEAAGKRAPRSSVNGVPHEYLVEGAENSVRFVYRQFLDQQQRLVLVSSLPRAGGVSENFDDLQLVIVCIHMSSVQCILQAIVGITPKYFRRP